MDINSNNSHDNIAIRLEELKVWQEEQQKILLERQKVQRKELGLEHEKMYRLYGLSSPNAKSKENDQEDQLDNRKESIFENSRSIQNIQLEDGISYLNNEISEIKLNNDNTDAQQGNEHNNSNENLSKRKFLKRGEGLKKRFNVHPNELRLGNLPRYKFAGAHNQKFPIKQKQPIKSNAEKSKLNSPLKIQNKNLLSLRKPEIIEKKLKLEAEENNCKKNHIKISSKDKTSNETPLEKHNTSLNCFDILTNSPINKSSAPEMKEIEILQEPTSWGKILDINNVEHPIPVKSFRSNTELEFSDTDGLSIFELLEQKAHEGSFALDALNIKKWIQNKTKQLSNESQLLEVNSERMKKTNILPFPFDIDQKLIPDESDETSSSDSIDDAEITTSETECNDKRVRFSDKIIEINEFIESDTETVKSSEIEMIDLRHNSTPNFERFKQRLFSEANDTNDSTIIENTLKRIRGGCDDIGNEEPELLVCELKRRLANLESEINDFKKNNLELTKMKQEHELEKIKLNQQKAEMHEQFNDEKIKLEICLHDERMKIEDDRKKLDKLIRDQKIPNRKEREEITKYKEDIENLKKELKDKESKHSAAQGRLRSQIRNFEKECKELTLEIEHLKKETKKLESENGRLNRMQNNKMLKEINKTISKLAPKTTEEAPSKGLTVSEIRNKNMKPFLAKVVSHKKAESISRVLNNNEILSQTDSNPSSDNDESSHHISKKPFSDFETEEMSKTRLKTNIHESNKSENVSNSNSNSDTNYHNLSTKQFKREIVNDDGSKDIWYPNGNLKKITRDGMQIRMLYFNKDIKETNISEGTIKYYYSETNTWHTTYLDGLEILEFPNGQTEHRYKDGTIEVHFENGSIRITNPKDEQKSEEWRYADGTQLIQLKSGDKILNLPNGQKEIHTKLNKRREYPDGTVKIVYSDGSQETRYSNGRVRLKDKNGTLVMDSETLNFS